MAFWAGVQRKESGEADAPKIGYLVVRRLYIELEARAWISGRRDRVVKPVSIRRVVAVRRRPICRAVQRDAHVSRLLDLAVAGSHSPGLCSKVVAGIRCSLPSNGAVRKTYERRV